MCYEIFDLRGKSGRYLAFSGGEMSKFHHDGDAERLSRRLADYLTIGPDGMRPPDQSGGGWRVSISVDTPMSISLPHSDDAPALLLELLTQEVLASVTPSLVTADDTGPDSRADDHVQAESDPATEEDGLSAETSWSLFVESWQRSPQLFGSHVH
jgi:hypothetical protein